MTIYRNRSSTPGLKVIFEEKGLYLPEEALPLGRNDIPMDDISSAKKSLSRCPSRQPRFLSGIIPPRCSWLLDFYRLRSILSFTVASLARHEVIFSKHYYTSVLSPYPYSVSRLGTLIIRATRNLLGISCVSRAKRAINLNRCIVRRTMKRSVLYSRPVSG